MSGRHALASLVLVCYTVVGLLIYGDYGISWDEPMQRSYGQVAMEYVLESDTALHQHQSRYHGPVFQMLLYCAELLSGDELNTYRVRHLITFLFSIVGLFFFYRLLLLLRFTPHWAVTGMLFLNLSPRIFAHSFYNSKDAVFMYAFIVGIYAITRFINKPKISSALWLGIAMGIAIDIRILGLFLPIFLIGIWAFKSVKDLPFAKQTASKMLLTGVACVLVIVAFWPTLWHNPILEFANALSKMGDYPWDDPVLFEGRFQLPKELPWYYLPKWIVISSPLLVIFLAVVGVISWLLNSVLPLWKRAIPFIWLAPLGVIIFKGATVYDGWRHVFFLYPALVILAVSGAQFLFGKNRPTKHLKWVPISLMLFPAFFIIKSHPNQQVYFNHLASENAWKNYEMDYWGLSYYQALQHVCQIQPDGKLLLSVANGPGFYNHYQLPKADQERIEWVSRDSADFFLSNFRFPQEHSAFSDSTGYYKNPLEIIEVDGNPIVGVFDLRD